MASHDEDKLATRGASASVDEEQANLDEAALSETIETLLTVAARASLAPVVSFLLETYPSVPASEEAFRVAVSGGSRAVISAFLARDPILVNVRFDRRGTPLALACTHRRPAAFLAFLLEAGADPNPADADLDTLPAPLATAASLYGDGDDARRVVELLLRHGARLPHSGALAGAAARGNENVVRFLLEKGARQSTDQVEGGGMRSGVALHEAVARGHVGVVRALLETSGGGDEDVVGARDGEGRTVGQVVERVEREQGGKDLSEVKALLGKYGVQMEEVSK